MEANRTPSELGDRLQDLCLELGGELIQLRADFAIMSAAYRLLRDRVHASNEVEPTDLFSLDPDSSAAIESVGPMLKRAELMRRVLDLRDSSPAISSLYQLVMLVEAWQSKLIAAFCSTTVPTPLKRKAVELSDLFATDDLKEMRSLAVERAVGSLLRGSQADVAKTLRDITQVDLASIPAFRVFVEAKSTRNAWVHNKGIADDDYFQKAGSQHRPISKGAMLPVTAEYFSTVCDAVDSLAEEFRMLVAKRWPPIHPFDPEAIAKSMLGF